MSLADDLGAETVRVYGTHEEAVAAEMARRVPWVCVCEDPRPDGIGECATCRRCVPSHSWHEGIPT